MRIALVSYRSDPFCGGQGIYIKYLSKHLHELGHTVEVISGEPYPDLEPGIRLIPMPGLNFYGYKNPGQAIQDRGIRSLTDIWECFGHLTGGFPEPLTFGQRAGGYLQDQARAYDLVHDNQSLSFGLLALTRKNIPLVTTLHHPITRDLQASLSRETNWGLRLLIKRWHSFLKMQKKVAPRLPQVITVSESSKKDIIQDFKLDPDRIEVIHNGVDCDLFGPRPGVPKIPGRIMTTTSADVPLKGLQFLLQAVQALQAEFPEINLTVLGKPKKNGKTWRLIQRLGLGPRVRFVKGLSTPDLCLEYAQSMMAVVPSLYEGFGLPAAEAMACALPVISTTGGALPEVVGDAGLLVPPGDAPALAQGIQTVLRNPDFRQTLGNQARARILGSFSWNLAAEKTVRVYHNALQCRQSTWKD